jgi:abhydrolase domain-containing protein 17
LTLVVDNCCSLFVCSTGNPSEENCYADIEAAYKFLRFDLHVPSQNIVLYGRSLGSGPSCYLASGTAQSTDPSLGGPVGGVILHAPFLSVYRIVIDTGCTVYGDKFPNIDYAPMIKSPLILVHGTADQIVPFNHSERLFEALPPQSRARPLYVEGMGHNNVHSVVRPMFVARLNEYLEEHVWPKVRQQEVPSSLPYGDEAFDTEEEKVLIARNSRMFAKRRK